MQGIAKKKNEEHVQFLFKIWYESNWEMSILLRRLRVVSR